MSAHGRLAGSVSRARREAASCSRRLACEWRSGEWRANEWNVAEGRSGDSRVREGGSASAKAKTPSHARGRHAAARHHHPSPGQPCAARAVAVVKAAAEAAAESAAVNSGTHGPQARYPTAGAGDAAGPGVRPTSGVQRPNAETRPSRQLVPYRGDPPPSDDPPPRRTAKESLLVYVELRKQHRDAPTDIAERLCKDALEPHHDRPTYDGVEKVLKDSSENSLKHITDKPRKKSSEKHLKEHTETQVRETEKQAADEISSNASEISQVSQPSETSQPSKSSQKTLSSIPQLSMLQLSSKSSVSSGDGDDSVPERREVHDRLRSWLSQSQEHLRGVSARRRSDTVSSASAESVMKSSGGYYERLSEELVAAASKCPLPSRDAAAAVEKLKRRAARLIASQQSRAQSAPARNARGGRGNAESSLSSQEPTEGISGSQLELSGCTIIPEDDTPISEDTSQSTSSVIFMPLIAHDISTSRLSNTNATLIRSKSNVNEEPQTFSNEKAEPHALAQSKLLLVRHLLRALGLLTLAAVLLAEQHELWRAQPAHWEFMADGAVPIDIQWPFRLSSPAVVVERSWNWVSAATALVTALMAALGAVAGDKWAARAAPRLAAVALACDTAALLYAAALLIPQAGLERMVTALAAPAAALGPRAIALAATSVALALDPALHPSPTKTPIA